MHPDPISFTLAIIGLLIFAHLWWKDYKKGKKPFAATTDLFVVILKVDPYDFEGNLTFGSKSEAERYRAHIPNGDDFKSCSMEVALDFLKSSYFNKGYAGVSGKY